ncbi:CCA tRNA nucleotidyltransferase [Candidatus Omnitrophota bacterium]
MRDYLKRLPQDLKYLIRCVGETAGRQNVRAYLVGGFVRDLILGVKNFDLDISVEAKGMKFAGALADSLGAKLTLHRKFGTATVSKGQGLKIDVATVRSEFYPEAGQLPVVSSGKLEDDLRRRDFSVNAMALSLNSDDYAKLIDPFGGRRDISKKIIRVLHDLSFIDDPTRMLRAVRFEKRYNFRIEAASLRLLKQARACGALEDVSAQRLRDEIILILKEAYPLKVLKRVQELCGLNFISQALRLSKRGAELLTAAGREIRWYKKLYSYRRRLDTWLVYLIGLLEPISADQANSVCARLGLRKGECKRILSFKHNCTKVAEGLSRKGVRPAKIFGLLEPLSYEEIILIKAKFRSRHLQAQVEDFFEIYNGMRVLVSGHDLERLGVAPGPYYQKIFSKVLEAKLHGEVKTHDQELELIRKLIS